MNEFNADSPLRDSGPEAWGWQPELHAHWNASCSKGSTLVPARILAREHHRYELVIPDFRGRAELPDYLPRMVQGATTSGRFSYEAHDSADYPVVGDWALVDPLEEIPRIQQLLPRLTSLVRGRAGTKTEAQVLLANIDIILLVFALDGGRNFLSRLLERALVVARSSALASASAMPLIILNKADLAAAEERDWAVAEAGRIAPGVPVIALSAHTKEGLADLSSFLGSGQTVGMLGKSGVGKSALVNALASGGCGSAPQALEGAVREDDRRGRHTTSSSRIRRLESGVLLADSPGIRELKIWDEALGNGPHRADEESALGKSFPEIADAARQCRFGDCRHEGEPGCAVAEALARGDISTERHLAWLELKREENWLASRVSEQSRMKEKAKWKEISKFQKALKKERFRR